MNQAHRFIVFSTIIFCVAILSCESPVPQIPETWNTGLIPKVNQIEIRPGGLLLDDGWSLLGEEGMDSLIEPLNEFLTEECNIDVSIRKKKYKSIILRIGRTPKDDLEEYQLEIMKDLILIESSNVEGLQRGISSLQQLILLNEKEGRYYLPYLNIKDYPRFQHRGLLLDCSRHFFDKEVVKKYIDLLALFKMNVLHWHITEDQGWRIEIDKYPRLTEVGAYRIEEDGTRYGGFFTKDDIRETVAYAARRHINIIPEIELPGHSQAAIASYPHLSCTGDAVPVANDWGVFKEIYCVGNDSTFIFLEDVLTEVMELFPYGKIHIGGDEAPKVRWQQCAKCQKRMKDEGLANEEELQSYFIKRIQKFLKANGRELIGWDEILEGGLADGAIVQSWRGMDGGIEAVKHGHQAIMSPTSHTYLDYGLDAIDLEKVYNFEPVPKGITERESDLIIGGECNMWTEHVPDEKTLDSKVFPRMLAMAEVLWSDTTGRDFKEFHQRIQAFYPLLEKYGVQYGEEAVPMSYEMVLDENKSSVRLIPYSNMITLKYHIECDPCDSEWKDYSGEIPVTSDGILQVQAFKNKKEYGDIISIPISGHQAVNADVAYEKTYSHWYTAGGEKGLVDAKLGTLNFRDGAWQGFWGDDLECVLKLSPSGKNISSVSANFYQYNNSWIFMPPKMEVWISDDKKNWTSIGIVKSTTDPKARGKFIENLSIELSTPIKASYIKIKAANFGKVPAWHEAAGSDAWVFIDEIQVK